MPVTPARATIGRPQRAERHGRGVGDERQPGRGERGESQADEDRGCNRDWRAEAGRAFEERAEREGDEQELETPVAGDAGQAVLHDLEVALLAGQVVEEDDVEDDPADGEEAVGRAQPRRPRGHARGHAEGEDGREHGGGQAEERRHVGPKLEEGQPAEKDDDGESGDERREPDAAERVVDLVPRHFQSTPSVSLFRRSKKAAMNRCLSAAIRRPSRVVIRSRTRLSLTRYSR